MMQLRSRSVGVSRREHFSGHGQSISKNPVWKAIAKANKTTMYFNKVEYAEPIARILSNEASMEDFFNVSKLTRVGMELASQGFFAEDAQFYKDTHEALRDCCCRFETLKKVGITPEQSALLVQLIEKHDKQLASASAADCMVAIENGMAKREYMFSFKAGKQFSNNPNIGLLKIAIRSRLADWKTANSKVLEDGAYQLSTGRVVYKPTSELPFWTDVTRPELVTGQNQ